MKINRSTGLHQNLQVFSLFLRCQLYVTIAAKPFGLLPPVLAVGKGPPKDIHELLFALAPSLNLCLRTLLTVWAVDPLWS